MDVLIVSSGYQGWTACLEMSPTWRTRVQQICLHVEDEAGISDWISENAIMGLGGVSGLGSCDGMVEMDRLARHRLCSNVMLDYNLIYNYLQGTGGRLNEMQIQDLLF